MQLVESMPLEDVVMLLSDLLRRETFACTKPMLQCTSRILQDWHPKNVVHYRCLFAEAMQFVTAPHMVDQFRTGLPVERV
jgi:hypothetical protein